MKTTLVDKCKSLVEAEDNPDKNMIERLDYIKNNTHEKLLIPLSTTELIILTNIGSKNFNRSIEFVDNNGKTLELPLHQIIRYAKESYYQLAQFVVQIAKKYSLDIPVKGDIGIMDIPDMMNPSA